MIRHIIGLFLFLFISAKSFDRFGRYMGLNSFDENIWKQIISLNLHSKPILIKSCHGNQSLNGSTGQSCKFLPLDISKVVTEGDMLRVLIQFCENEIQSVSIDGAAFFGGMGGLVDCMKMMHIEVMARLYGDMVVKRDYNKYLFPTLQLNVPASRECSPNWMWNIEDKAFGYYSQGTQDGVLLEIFNHLVPYNNYFIEIGYNTNDWAVGSNTYFLHHIYEWNGLLLDASHENKTINLHKHFVTTDNILQLFDMYDVPGKYNYMHTYIVIEYKYNSYTYYYTHRIRLLYFHSYPHNITLHIYHLIV